MALDERARHTLYTWMQETADDEKAEALMASLPPTGWPDLATKQDLGILRTEMEAMEHRLTAVFRQELTGAITSQTRTLTFQSVSLFMAFALFAWAMR